MVASGYRLGTLRSIGPGFLPTVLGCLLCAVGAAIAMQRHRPEQGAEVAALAHPWRAAAIPASLACFGLLIDRLHLLLAVAALVAVARLAMPALRWHYTLAAYAVLAAIASVLFVFGLDLPASFLLPG